MTNEQETFYLKGKTAFLPGKAGSETCIASCNSRIYSKIME